MKQLTCEVCGSTDLIKDSGVFVCQFCGCKFTIEEVRKLMVEGVVEVTGTVKVDNTEQIENILVNARRSYEDGRYKEAQALYQQVLAADPNNIEAILFEGISAGWQGNLVRYTMQQATDATLRALQIASNKTEQPEELEEFVWKGLSEITELGNAVVSLCEKSTQESVKRGERELESVKRYSDQAGLYADFDWIRQRGDNAIATLEADEKRYGEIKDNTYLLVLSVYEEVLKIFKDIEKYELEIFDKMTLKLKTCKMDKNAYYKMTANKYQNVLESIQKKKKAKEDYFRKLEEARVKQYWEEHKEEQASLNRKLEELYDEKNVLIRANAEYEKFIELLQKEKLREITLEKEIIQSDFETKISCIKKEKKIYEKRLTQIEQDIEDIQYILKTANSESYTENVEEIINKITETYIDDESLLQIKEKTENYRLERERKEEVFRLEDEAKRKIEEEKRAEESRIQQLKLEEEKREKARKRKKATRVLIIVVALGVLAVVGAYVAKNYIIPDMKYKQAEEALANNSFEEAITIYTELHEYKDSEEKITECRYQQAKWYLESEEYMLAIDTLREIESYKDSSDLIKENLFFYAKNLMADKQYKEAIEIFEANENVYEEARNLRQEASYYYALELSEQENYEEAIEYFDKAFKFADTQDKKVEAKYKYACQLLNNDELQKAMALFGGCSGYLDSDEKMKDTKYRYVVLKKDYFDMTTYNYLKELSECGYPNAKQMYNEYYSKYKHLIQEVESRDAWFSYKERH